MQQIKGNKFYFVLVKKSLRALIMAHPHEHLLSSAVDYSGEQELIETQVEVKVVIAFLPTPLL